MRRPPFRQQRRKRVEYLRCLGDTRAETVPKGPAQVIADLRDVALLRRLLGSHPQRRECVLVPIARPLDCAQRGTKQLPSLVRRQSGAGDPDAQVRTIGRAVRRPGLRQHDGPARVDAAAGARVRRAAVGMAEPGPRSGVRAREHVSPGRFRGQGRQGRAQSPDLAPKTVAKLGPPVGLQGPRRLGGRGFDGRCINRRLWRHGRPQPSALTHRPGEGDGRPPQVRASLSCASAASTRT